MGLSLSLCMPTPVCQSSDVSCICASEIDITKFAVTQGLSAQQASVMAAAAMLADEYTCKEWTFTLPSSGVAELRMLKFVARADNDGVSIHCRKVATSLTLPQLCTAVERSSSKTYRAFGIKYDKKTTFWTEYHQRAYTAGELAIVTQTLLGAAQRAIAN